MLVVSIVIGVQVAAGLPISRTVTQGAHEEDDEGPGGLTPSRAESA